MNFNLHDRTIFLCLSGSHAYGMSKPTSDYDYRGVCIPPLSTFIGFVDSFEQSVSADTYKTYPTGMLKDDPRVDGADPNTVPDMQVYNLLKFMRLALSNNPSILEILFTHESDFIMCDPIMEKIFEHRDKILSKQVKARFCGYALSQLKRIKGHKKWLDNPPKKKPVREDFGLPESGLLSPDQIGAAGALIQKEIDSWMIDQTHLPEDIKIELGPAMRRQMEAVWRAINSDKVYPIGESQKFEHTDDAIFWGAAGEQGFSENFLQVLAQEKAYRSAKREWDQYQTWKKQRNEKRAELESKHGFDTKHASHLVRLLRMAREILETGKVHVKRPDAEELLEIRNGAWSYEKLIDFSEREDKELIEVMNNSSLPKVPDMKFFDKLIRDIIIEYNESKK